MRYAHPALIPQSDRYSELRWIGDRIPCATYNHRGDTHPQTWADDDNTYIGTGDPLWIDENGVAKTPGDFDQSKPAVADYVFRRITGLVFESLTGDPEHFDIRRENDMTSFIGWGGSGPKPSGMISVDGVLYYAVQNLLGWKAPRHGVNSQHGSDCTILRSTDHGKTWAPCLDALLDEHWKDYSPNGGVGPWNWPVSENLRTHIRDWEPMFPGNLFGGLSFVQFGKDNADAVDGYVYAVSGDHWDNGSELRLGRVPKDKIMDRSAWEFAIPHEDGSVEWTEWLVRSEPILAIERHVSLPEMVYLTGEKKYLLLTWAMHQDFTTKKGSELTVLESDHPWGPFRLVHYEWMWYNSEAGHYCPRVPLKWFDQEKLEGYLLYSGNWEVQAEYYRPQLRKFKLIPRTRF